MKWTLLLLGLAWLIAISLASIIAYNSAGAYIANSCPIGVETVQDMIKRDCFNHGKLLDEALGFALTFSIPPLALLLAQTVSFLTKRSV